MELGELVSVAVPISKAKEPKPTIKAKWTRVDTRPDHNGRRFPPHSPPTDRVQNKAKARMRVTLTNVPNGTKAKITVFHCHTGAKVKDGVLDNLTVHANRVIDSATGLMPFFVFEDKHNLWDPWDKPYYFFKVEVDYQGLSFETPKDFKAKPEETMRIRYWHVSVSDAIADTPAGGNLTTRSEMREIATILRRKKHHSVYTHAFNTNIVPVSHWGSILRNSYIYHHASHGDIINPAGAQLNVAGNPPPPQPGSWNSVVVLGNSTFGAAEVKQTANVPSVPRYLVYMDTCVAGWETSLGKAFITRGTQNYIAFRMYIPDGDARDMARKFYRKWSGTHLCDPDRIAQVFYDVGSPYYSSMRPILLGKGGGQISRFNAMNQLKGGVQGFVADVKSLIK